MAELDPNALSKLKVVDLREHLSNRGLPTAGLKAELVKRLRAALLDKSFKNEDSSVSNEEEIQEDEEEPDLKAAEEARLKAEEEAELKAERDAQIKAEEEAKLKAERDAQIKAEEAKLKEEREAQLKAEKEAQARAEEARLRAEEETRKRNEEDKKRAEEEAKKRAEEEAKKRAEEEAKKRAEEAKKRAEEEVRKRAEEEARKRAEETAQRRAEEEARQKVEEEIRHRAEEARLRNEKEAQLKVEAEARRKAEEAERKAREEAKLKAEVEAKRREEENLRKKEEQRVLNDKRLAEEERVREKQRKIDEEEMRKEQERWLVEEQMRRAQEDHKKRMKAEEEKHKLELEKQKKFAEEQKQLAEEQTRKAEEEKILKEVEQRRNLEQVQQMSLPDNELQNEQLTFPNVPPGLSPNLQMPPMPPFSSMPSMTIIPPPPTVLMSNINTLLPPGTSLPPNTIPQQISNISAPSIFPPPIPLNIMKPPVSSPIVLNNQELVLNGIQQNSNLEPENNESSEMMDSDENSEIRLPQALEKVLALKSERAQLLGVDPDSVQQLSDDKTVVSKPSVVTLVSIEEDEYGEDDESANKRKDSKTKRRKKKKKKRQSRNLEKTDSMKYSERHSQKDSAIDVDIEYVQEVIDITDPMYSQFMRIFEKFKLTDNEKENEDSAADMKNAVKEEIFNPLAIRKKPIDLDDDDDDYEKDDDKLEEEKPKLSKRKMKKLSRMSVAELKQKVCRPELVEMHDVTAKDPVLLLHLKASRNTVPVPRHWCFKRKYLQGKRGIEKPAFELPDFIKRTGIMEMRQALQEKEDQKTMKAKMRERVRPKLGKIDIDYQKLHDAFFKWQTKPKMTIHGDLYYEGKEFETRLKEKKPGDLSEDLRTALGMPTGPNANKCPPPWLIAMQRYGPPPSYPNLKIAGLNAPIPEGCSFGYHAGGWGKPPVDETGRPLYGDVFGTQTSDNQPHIPEEEIDHTLWGELESESSEEEEDEEEEEEEDEEEKVEDETGLVTPAEGLITPSGFSSIPAGMETPDMIELRKRKIESEMEGGETPALYTILPEKKTERVGAAMMGSTHIYDLAAAIPGSKLKGQGTTSVPPQGIEVALDPSELEMDSAAMAARYEQTMREQQSQLEKEDLSDMVAEHAARQKNKRKKQQLDNAKPPKKYKEFKF